MIMVFIVAWVTLPMIVVAAAWLLILIAPHITHHTLLKSWQQNFGLYLFHNKMLKLQKSSWGKRQKPYSSHQGGFLHVLTIQVCYDWRWYLGSHFKLFSGILEKWEELLFVSWLIAVCIMVVETSDIRCCLAPSIAMSKKV